MFFDLIWRTALFYVLILVVLRLLGKREVDQLAPIDLIVVIMIAELAVIPIEDNKMPIWAGVVPIVVLGILEVGLALVCLWSARFRGLIYGSPSVVVRNGRIIERELRKIRWNIDELFQQLRLNGNINLQDVEVALVETNGKLSVIPKSQKRPVQAADLGVPTSYEGLELILVKDGEIDQSAMRYAHLDESWLKQRLAENGIGDVRDCFLAALTTAGELCVQAREGVRTPQLSGAPTH